MMEARLKKGGSSFTLVSHHNEPRVRTMNKQLLYQWEEEIAERLPILNSWQVANVALFSYGVARQVVCAERVESATRRWRRFLDNANFPLAGFFQAWRRWVVEAMGSQALTLLVDETKVHERMGAMVVGLAWEGRCIPLA